MAENEAARKTCEPVVVSDSPDVCLTPPGVPVPYSIVSYFPSSTSTANTVLLTEDPTFTTVSSIPGVIGDEAGSLGGVCTGTNSGGGWVHVVEGSHTPNVRAEGQLIVFHDSKMEMNCSSPLGPGNTVGTCLWQSTMRDAWVDEEGNVEGETDPEDEPENEAELDEQLDAENPKSESEWSTEGSHEADYGRDAGMNEDYGRKVETEVGIERSHTTEGNLMQFGGEDANVQVGSAHATGKYGASFDGSTGEIYGGGEAGFETISAHGELGGEAANVHADVEALSAEVAGEVKGSFGPDGASLAAKAGADATLVSGSVGGEVTVTTQDVVDATVNKVLGWFDQERVELPKAIGDTGVVVSGEVEGSIGAKIEGEAKATATTREVRFGAGVAGALGPGAGVKGSVGLKLGEGLVDGAVDWFKSWF